MSAMTAIPSFLLDKAKLIAYFAMQAFTFYCFQGGLDALLAGLRPGWLPG
jgi:hypothetical protein